MDGAELTCIVHVHSVYSDGTGTVAEIAAAAARTGADVVVVTDHDDTRAAAEAGWRDGVLVAAGHEISPGHGSHTLALGVPRPVRHRGRPLAAVLDEVHAAGGLAFAAHPFSRGGWLLGRAGRAAPFGDLRLGVDGIELWSLVTDTLEHLHSPWRLLRFARDPDAVLADPPAANLAAWDAIGARRRMPAFAGLDAHQYGIRRGGRVVVRTMPYERTFALLRTHVLLDAPPTGDAAADTAAVGAAMAAGRAFLARDSLADATGFRFGAAGGGPRMGGEARFEAPVELVARAPADCELRLWRDGRLVAGEAGARELRHVARGPGVWRVSAHLRHRGRLRTWVLANPVYLR
ncbi:MAG: CehA/McbA family metallohydrolase [Solirubrobacteraceae bacterium]|nr:CehA/McbA family metallohydrolase [Solirubrobacteraceae bacterium]